MSRTYRRKKCSPPDWVTEEYVYGNKFFWVKKPIEDKNVLKKNIAKWRSDAGWHGNYSVCPGWWNHEYHELPFRRKVRDLLKKIVNTGEYEVVFPLHKKPHIYYW